MAELAKEKRGRKDSGHEIVMRAYSQMETSTGATPGKNSLLDGIRQDREQHGELVSRATAMFGNRLSEVIDPEAAGRKLKQYTVDQVDAATQALTKWLADMALPLLSSITQMVAAVAQHMPAAWLKPFVDFWNGPWRTLVIVGLSTIGAATLTAAIPGVGAGLATAMVSGAIGGTLAGGTTFLGDAFARAATIQLSPDGKLYVPKVGEVSVDPTTGQLATPSGDIDPALAAELPKLLAWAMSNFENANGQRTAKSSTELATMSAKTGAKAAGQGFILGAAGGGGGILARHLGTMGGALVSEAGRKTVTAVATAAAQGGIDLTTFAMNAGWTAAFTAAEEGRNAPLAMIGAMEDSYSDPGLIFSTLLSMGMAPLHADLIKPLLDKLSMQTIRNAADATYSTAVYALGMTGGTFVEGVRKAASPDASLGDMIEAGWKNAQGVLNNIAPMWALRFASASLASRPQVQQPTATGPTQTPAQAPTALPAPKRPISQAHRAAMTRANILATKLASGLSTRYLEKALERTTHILKEINISADGTVSIPNAIKLRIFEGNSPNVSYNVKDGDISFGTSVKLAGATAVPKIVFNTQDGSVTAKASVVGETSVGGNTAKVTTTVSVTASANGTVKTEAVIAEVKVSAVGVGGAAPATLVSEGVGGKFTDKLILAKPLAGDPSVGFQQNSAGPEALGKVSVGNSPANDPNIHYVPRKRKPEDEEGAPGPNDHHDDDHDGGAASSDPHGS